MGKPKAPTPPDPVKTAAAQTQSNRETAITQSGLNMVNQVGPQGSLTYSQDGTWQDGTPRFTQTTSLSPEMQGITDNLMGGAGQLAANLNTQAGEPLDWSAQQGFLNDLTQQNLDPAWARNEESFRTDLANRGIGMGSTAFDDAMDSFQRSRSSAYNDANLSNYGTALSSQLALRNQPINELSALMSGTQVAQPQFGATPQTGVAGTDIAGITQSGYGNEVNAYNTQMQNQNQMMGGLFSAGANLLPFLLSDERAKTDKKRVGETDEGTPIYTYRYKDGGPTQMGVMAQDMQKKDPKAVVKMGSLLGVDYRRVA